MPPRKRLRTCKEQAANVGGSGEAILEKSSSRDGQNEYRGGHTFSYMSMSGSSRVHLGNTYNNYAAEDEEFRKASRIIDTLYFPEINWRRDAVRAAEDDTFEWLLDPEKAAHTTSAVDAVLAASESKDSVDRRRSEERWRHKSRLKFSIGFTDWLRSGNGIYWICGKAGSGKTTLMKYLSCDDRTLDLLTEWAGDSDLVFASHFFWHPGIDLQKSHEGLYRSLLYQIFKINHSLIKTACPEKWSSGVRLNRPWSGRDLINAMENLRGKGHKFCFFIDGLDEYHPQSDHCNLLEYLSKLSLLPHVKLCVSSRPWQVFCDRLGKLTTRASLEDLTRLDMEAFTLKRLRAAAADVQTEEDFLLEPMSSSAARLVEDVVNRAEGVFLWTYLVLQRLTERLRSGESLKSLGKHLSAFPSELESYLKHMVYERIHPTWHESSDLAALLKLMLALHESSTFVPIRLFWPLANDHAIFDPRFGLDGEIVGLPDSWFANATQTTIRFVQSCCADLLTISAFNSSIEQGWEQWTGASIDYAHRSVADFLQSEDMQQLLNGRLPQHLKNSQRLVLLSHAETVRLVPAELSSRNLWFVLEDTAVWFLDYVTSTPGLAHISDAAQAYDRAITGVFDNLISGSINFTIEKPQYGGPMYPLISYLMQLGTYSFVRRFANCIGDSEHFRIAVLQGALGCSPEDSITRCHHTQTIEVAPVMEALRFKANPNQYVFDHAMECDVVKDQHSSSRTTIWHVFLIFWWRMDPQRGSAETLDFMQIWHPTPAYGSMCRLSEMPADTALQLWKIAKILIEHGASTTDHFCLTGNCKVSNEYGDYIEAHKEECLRASVVDVLEILVPIGCLEELEVVVRDAKERPRAPMEIWSDDSEDGWNIATRYTDSDENEGEEDDDESDNDDGHDNDTQDIGDTEDGNNVTHTRECNRSLTVIS